MKLIVKNFGAIKEIKIDLSKKIYLFVGYNNTGKTYLSNLFYIIFSKTTLSNFSDSSYNTYEMPINNSINLSKILVNKLLKSFGKYLVEIEIPKVLKLHRSNFIIKNLQIDFLYDEIELKKPKLESKAEISVTTDSQSSSNISIYLLKKPKNSLKATLETKSNKEIYDELPQDFFDNIPKKKFEDDINSIKKDHINKLLTHTILNLLIQNKEEPFLLPANRISLLENADDFINQDYTRKKELAELFIEAFDSKKLSSKKFQDLLLKKAESKQLMFIDNILSLINNLRTSKNDEFIKNGTFFYSQFLEKMSVIMGGQIIMNKETNQSNWREKFVINLSNKELNFNLVSSSVNQLSLLFLYFKYWAKQQENFLMIDEPEINLHPENQIYLTNLLLEFATSNKNKLLITTHSPLVVEIINNYLIKNKVKSLGLDISDELENLNYFNRGIDISNESIAIYSFLKDGSIIEYDMQEYGVLFKTFNQEINKIAEVKSILTDQIYYKEN